jgi:replicative DNA helicase
MRLLGIDVTEHDQPRLPHSCLLRLPAPYRLTPGRHHPVRNWLEPFRLWGSSKGERFIPESILGLPPERVAMFLRHLWTTQGANDPCGNHRRAGTPSPYGTTSRRLADGIQRALLRLDIRSRVTPAGKEGRRVRWDVTVVGANDLTQFLRVVGGHDMLPGGIDVPLQSLPDQHTDLIPASIAPTADAALRRAGMTPRQTAQLLEERTSDAYPVSEVSEVSEVSDTCDTSEASRSAPGPFSRRLLSTIATTTGDRHLLALAESDVFWDQIVEITSLGEMPTFDATVAGTHNFVANGVIAHNSLEQDADVVLFLYRDEMYNPESADRGSAEVIVAKHRNGPTGKCQLAFLDHYTRFANMARV